MINKLFNYRPHFLLPVSFAVLILLAIYLSIFHFDPLHSQRLYYDLGREQFTHGADFNNFYFAAKRLAAGENFYLVNDPAQSLPGELAGGATRFIYPPLLAYLFVPFSFLSLNTAFYIYALFTVALLSALVYLLSRFFSGSMMFLYATTA